MELSNLNKILWVAIFVLFASILWMAAETPDAYMLKIMAAATVLTLSGVSGVAIVFRLQQKREERFYLINTTMRSPYNAIAFWAKGKGGYTTLLGEAHRFTKEEAAYFHIHGTGDYMIPCGQVERRASRLVFREGHLEDLVEMSKARFGKFDRYVNSAKRNASGIEMGR